MTVTGVFANPKLSGTSIISAGVIEMADKEQHTSLVHTFYSLERPDWLMNSGMGKGIFHDRYALGAVLSAGVKIRFRQSFPASGMGSILQLLNNDSKTEIQQEVTTAWRELISNVSSVPFFTTPYTEHARERIGIEVEIEGDWKILPIYKAGEMLIYFLMPGIRWMLNTRCLIQLTRKS